MSSAGGCPLLVEDYLTHLAVEKGRAENTLVAYRRDLRTYVELLGSTPLEEATRDDILGLVRSLQAHGLADASINRTLASVRGLHRFLVAEGLATNDPTADVDARRLGRGLPRALTENEVAELIDAVLGDDPAALRDRAILETLYGTGVRVGELVALSLDDLDLDAALMRVQGKGSKQRLAPLGRLAHRAVEEWLRRGRAGFVPGEWPTRDAASAVFLNHRGGRLSRQGAWGVVRKYALRTGLADRLTPHVLRHSCATHMIDHGADIRTVQELLGHASVTTTQLYTKVSTDLMRREYARTHPRASGRPGAEHLR